MLFKLPTTTKAVVVRKSPPERRPLSHDTILEDRSIPSLRQDELLIKMSAASFNHRDLWIQKGRYPGIVFGSVLGSDGVGTVLAAGNDDDPLLNKRVFLVPMRGWESAPEAPEERFAILGGGSYPGMGAFSEYVVVERDQVILAPDHLDDIHVAAWPLGGVTAWRVVTINAQVEQGHNVLITGIGGGVALTALQLCLAKGANVYVTSGNDDKIQRAVALGARAGANYKSKDWPARLGSILEKDNKLLDVVIDSGGGDILGSCSKYLKAGGKVVVYGMTAGPNITLTMREVLKNQRLIGSTMGSHKDLIDATNFLKEHRIVPILSHVLDGLAQFNRGLELMERGDQYGKIAIVINKSEDSRAKL